VKKWVKRFVPIGIVIAVIASFAFAGIASQKAPSVPNTAEKALVARRLANVQKPITHAHDLPPGAPERL